MEAELVFALREARNAVVINLNGRTPVRGGALAQDVLEISGYFSARIYGSRSHKNRKLVEAAKVLSELSHEWCDVGTSDTSSTEP